MTLPEDTILENRYRIDGLLAHGGMGAIYRAFDTNLSTPVAIKENFFQTPHHVAQFKQEALILARLRHPALPRVSHHFSFEGQHYLVMDYIEGENLWEIVQRRGEPLAEKESLDYIIQVCQAVGYLHRQTPPIIHRDIKPQNIKITPQGRAMLVDFGIAKQVFAGKSHTETGAQGVTSGFSPPEQYSGGTVPATDIYALGATLYAVLTGQKPPDSVSLLMGRAKFKAPDSVNSKLSPQVSQVIADAMQPKVAQRPQSVVEWQRTLETIAGSTVLTDQDERPTFTSVARPTIDTQETLHDTPPAPQLAAPKFWLVDSTGMGYALGLNPLSIGRHSGCDVVIEDLNVSRTHTLVRAEDNRCFVKDENSANGTFLNGHRLRPEWYPFNQGDVLVIGPSRFYLTPTKPVKLAPPKVAMPEASLKSDSTDIAAASVPISQPSTTEPAVSAKSKSKLPLLVAMLLVIVILAGAAGYLWFNPDILSTAVPVVSKQNDVSTAQTANQTETAEATTAESADVSIQQTTEAAANTVAIQNTEAAHVEATKQAEEVKSTKAAQQVSSTQTAQAVQTTAVTKETKAEENVATAQALANKTKTTTPESKFTPTITPTQILTGTPAGTPAPTRKPVAVGPTLMPLDSLESVDKIGSKEVLDVDINPQNPKEVFALVKGDGIYKSSNGGDGPWAKVNLNGSSITSVSIDPSNPARIYASTWNAVLKSEDGGNTWDPKTNGLLSNQVVDEVTVHPSNPDILYAGVGETLVVSTDQGENWTSEQYGEGLRMGRLYRIVVDPFNNDTVYVAGLAGSIYKSDNSGRNFIQLKFNTGKAAYGLAAHPAQKDVYLVGFNSFEGGIAKTVNGFDFSLVNDGLIFGGADSAYSAITYVPSNPNIVYAGSGYESNIDAKGIFKSIDGGEKWSRVNKGLAINPGTGYPHYVKAIAIDPKNPNTVFAATGSGLYRSVDGGANWVLR